MGRSLLHSRRERDIGEHLTKAVRAVVRQNPALAGVIDFVDFASERNGERDINPAKLAAVIETFSDPRYRLGLADVQADFLGRAYEYLLRKFAEDERREVMRERVASWARRLNVQPRQVRVQCMTRKWGSCSTAGIVTLAADLADQDLDFQDFVIVHELLHLRVPNHGKLFKALLTAHGPSWQTHASQRTNAKRPTAINESATKR